MALASHDLRTRNTDTSLQAPQQLSADMVRGHPNFQSFTQRPQISNTHTPYQAKAADPEQLFTKLDRIGKGSFGEVFKGYVGFYPRA